MAAKHAHDVADLVYAEQCRDPRHQVFAECRRRAEYVRVTVADRDNLGGEDRRDRMRIERVVDVHDLFDTVNCRSLLRECSAILCKHDHMDFRIRYLAGTTDALGGCRIDVRAVVFGDQQYFCHYNNPLSCSAATRPGTSSTRIPF